MAKLMSIFRNNVVIYLTSRYVTYFLQFVTSLVIAAKLGPFHFGVWGFILLLLNYFQQCHFGIYNSMNVLYVQHREDARLSNDYLVNSIVLECYLALVVFGLYAIYHFSGLSFFSKYNADKYLFIVCCIAVLQYFSNLFINIFRVKNRLLSVAFCQSVIVLLNFACIFFFTGEKLIYALVLGYLVGNIVIVTHALCSRLFELKGVTFSLAMQRQIVGKGIMLFLYNTGFYFIIISIRTIISGKYEVEEFGLFTFSFSLAHAVMLLLESLTFVVFPKMIGKLSSPDTNEVKTALYGYREVYMTSAHGLIYVALLFFPLILHFFPKYGGALTSMNLIALTILLDTSRCGYTELLIAHNKEKKLSAITLFVLALDVALAIVAAYVLRVPFSYVILAAMVSYLVFATLVAFEGRRLVPKPDTPLLADVFPPRLAIPFLAALVVCVLQLEYVVFVPLLLFAALNIRACKHVAQTAKGILAKPELVNL